MKKLAILMLIVLVSAASALAQPTIVNGVKVDPARGSKCESCVVPTTDVVAPKPDNTRGMCCIFFDNWTGYYLDVWVDGTYRGRIGPWTSGEVCVDSGWTTWYVKTSGGTYYWSGEGVCNERVIVNIE